MLILKATDLHKSVNGAALFENVSFEVREGERVALYGRNGAGKTTLLKGLLGTSDFDGGTIRRELPLEQWGWLEQHVEADPGQTVLEFVQAGSGELYRIKQELERLQQRMNEQESGRHAAPQHAGGEAGGGGEPLSAVLDQYGRVYEQYVQLDGYAWEVKAEKSLGLMKLDPSLWTLPLRSLSGGQKTRAQLAALIVREPKFVVLDEPTNHLDEETLEWLEQWVRSYAGTVLYVSHDRAFIDRTADAVIELEAGGCRRYTGGYTDFRRQKELELRTQETVYRKQEQERKKLLESIRRYSEWFQQAHRSAGQNDFYRSKSKKNVSRLHAKEAALERLESGRVQKPREADRLRMRLEADAFAAPSLLSAEGASFAHEGGRELFGKLTLQVNRGDRIAVFGPNGAGKSTLLKLLAGRLTPSSGTIRLHPQAKIGYFAQELDHLDPEETILGSLLKLPDMTQTKARTIMGCFLFPREDAYKVIGRLSMGEQCRLAFLMLLFGGADLLVLDEPTNYLDVDTRERVEEALLEFGGAFVLVSHDRYFVRRAASRLILMDGKGAPILFSGPYDEYRSQDRSRSLSPAEQGRINERARLELRLAQLMSLEEPADEEERRLLLEEIRRLRQMLQEIPFLA